MKIMIEGTIFSAEEPGTSFGWVYANVIIPCPLSEAQGINCEGKLMFSELSVGRVYPSGIGRPLKNEPLFGDSYSLNPSKSGEAVCSECGITVHMTDQQIKELFVKTGEWGRSNPPKRTGATSRRGRQ
ncbi:MAG: hypothetical protein Q7S63_01660 [bacterium]|nr:hypothetical protein [bacterium]